jgi:hypothetical protein
VEFIFQEKGLIPGKEMRPHIGLIGFNLRLPFDPASVVLIRQNIVITFDIDLNEPHLGSVEIFYSLKEAQVLIEQWRLEYNTFRPHSSLKYRPPAPEA